MQNNNKNPFTTPENYFESLPDRVMSSINNEQNNDKFALQMLKPYLAVAAVFFAIFGFWFMILGRLDIHSSGSLANSTTDTTATTIATTMAEVADYYEATASENQIIEMLVITESQTETETKTDKTDLQALQDDDIIDYLLSDGMEESGIMLAYEGY